MQPDMQPAAKKQRVEGSSGKQQQQQGKKSKKPPSPEIQVRCRLRTHPVVVPPARPVAVCCPLHLPANPHAFPAMPQTCAQVRMEIHAAARANDVGAALAALDRALESGIRVAPDCYVSVLYLCSGGDSWERQLRSSAEGAGAGEEEDEAQQQQQQPEAAEADTAAAADAAGPAEPAALRGPQPSAEEVARRAQALFAEMQASGGRLPLNEMCYTALARLAALQGDADRAFALAQEAAAAGIPPKLRSYTPALIAYAERGACDKAFEGGWAKWVTQRAAGRHGRAERSLPRAAALALLEPPSPHAMRPTWADPPLLLLQWTA